MCGKGVATGIKSIYRTVYGGADRRVETRASRAPVPEDLDVDESLVQIVPTLLAVC